MYRSYSVNNMPTPVSHKSERKPEAIKKEEPNLPKPHHEDPPKKGGFLDNLQSDDIILLVVILMLMMDNCDDKLLLAALGIVFAADMF